VRKKFVLAVGIVLVISSLLFQSASVGFEGPVTGAIFTTLEDGTRVNANHYADKRDVYLDGGPGPNAPQEAAGLPDGSYYFQVTDPSGKVLLSEDPVFCREFRVENGIIAEYVSMGRYYTEVSKGKGKGNGGEALVPCHIDGWEFGKHDTGLDVDHGAVTIQLMPYENTPNRGGVYKAWATPVAYFDGDETAVDNGYYPGYFHGFIPQYSKTDNYKVKLRPKPTPEIEICKYRDTNQNCQWDPEDPPIAGWKITVIDPLQVTNTYYTGEDGCFKIYAPVDGWYIIEEELPEGWSVKVTWVDGVYAIPSEMVLVEVNSKKSMSYKVVYVNYKCPECWKVRGYKYNDLNGDGDLDAGEPGINGWTITLYVKDEFGAWVEIGTRTTGCNGYYQFIICEDGEYKIVEEQRAGWTPTTPPSYEFTGEGNGVYEFNFLNHYPGCGG